MIATPEPASAVGRGEQGVASSGVGEVGDQGAVGALGRDGEDALNERGVLGVAVGGEAEQRADGA